MIEAEYCKPTKQEVEALVKELSERLKDMVYATAETNMRQTIRQCGFDKKISTNTFDKIKINFAIEMVNGDLLQVIARERRSKSEVL